VIKKKISPFFILFLWLYRWLAVPLMLTMLFTFGLWLSPKIRRGFRLRQESSRRPKPQWMGKVRPVWIHASSGEFEYAKSLIRELKEREPNIPILVTYFSPSHFKNIANTKGVDWHEPLPLDTQAATQSFIQLWKPKILLIARTDLWPELLFQCRRAQVPSMLFSATFSEKKMKSFFSRQLLRLLIPLLDEVHVVTQEDQDQLSQITQHNNNKHYVTGDTRYDQVHFRLAHPNALKLELKPAAGESVLIAGSTWQEDEDVLIASLGPFVESGQLRLMIAPHEPTNRHLANLELRLSALGLQSLRYSQASQWIPNAVLLIDELGILADLYSWGHLAFVGGSFRNSVHSVMEPLGSGSLTFVGPRHHNNREAIEFKKIPAVDISKELADVDGLKMVEVIESTEQWTQKLKIWLSIPESHALISKQIAREVLQKGGASKRIVAHLSQLFSGIIVQK
jgi:3-deoxy-D-manno-octulosonic-acid transferase